MLARTRVAPSSISRNISMSLTRLAWPPCDVSLNLFHLVYGVVETSGFNAEFLVNARFRECVPIPFLFGHVRFDLVGVNQLILPIAIFLGDALEVGLVLIEHDERVQLFDNVIAVGGDENLHAQVHESRQESGNAALGCGMEILFGFIYHEQVGPANDMAQIKPQVQERTHCAGTLDST